MRGRSNRSIEHVDVEGDVKNVNAFEYVRKGFLKCLLDAHARDVGGSEAAKASLVHDVELPRFKDVAAVKSEPGHRPHLGQLRDTSRTGAMVVAAQEGEVIEEVCVRI